jgi:hypothetical protein
MRVLGDDDFPEWARALLERAQRDAEALVPRPGCPIYGMASPVLRPVVVSRSSQANGQWEQITLSYGDTPTGPYVTVTTEVADAVLFVRDSGEADVEAVLRDAIEDDRQSQGERLPDGADTVRAEVTRERLPSGDALVVRDGGSWAARLAADGTEAVTVTLSGMGVAPEDVRLETLPDLRSVIMERYEYLVRRVTELRRNPPPRPPLPELPPAEGVAALRALADFSLASHAEIRAAVRARSKPGHAPGWGPTHAALWQRAVREQQRAREMDARAADEAVTSVINHLGHLAEEAWFTLDDRLREAAIDETLRHAMLGDAVLSAPAQLAWSRYWSAGPARAGHPADPAAARAADEARLALEAGWRAAWEAWTRQAPGTGES